MDYEDRLIIYIDVLGFSDFVNYTTISQINRISKIEKINSFLKLLKSFFDDENKPLRLSETKQVTVFSDLIVVSINLKEIKNIDLEVMDVFYLLLNATYKGFLLRGSIIYGKLIHTEQAVFGPGLIEAYNQEKVNAKFPRIIIDSAIVKDIKELIKEYPDITVCDCISCDFDGYYYIDMFKNMREYTSSFREYIKILSSYAEILCNILENPKLEEKTRWMIEKFTEHINTCKTLDYYLNPEKIDCFGLEVFQIYLAEFDTEEFENKL